MGSPLSVTERLRLALQNAQLTLDNIVCEEIVGSRRNSMVAQAARAESRAIGDVLKSTDGAL